MSKNKLGAVSGSSNCWLCGIRVFRVVILMASLLVSIWDKRCCIISWPSGFLDSIGVSLQIISALVALVVSIIGITISLQNEDFLGIKTTKLYALRVKKNYSVRDIIFISIILCVWAVICYLLKLVLAVIVAQMAIVSFLLQVVISEVPLMMKNKKVIFQILKDNMIYCYINGKEATKDLKDTMRYLLYKETLNEVYKSFRDPNDEEYNIYLFLKLLEYQCDLAFKLVEKIDENEKIEIASSLLENVCDILYQRLDSISSEAYALLKENKHLLTRVLFCIHELSTLRNSFETKISNLLQHISFSANGYEQKCDLIADVIIVLVAKSIEKKDFSIIKAIRRQFSNSSYCLERECYALDVFNIISMYLYYLCCSEINVTDELKNAIRHFIDEDNVIEYQTKIMSWRRLFVRLEEQYNVNYDRFMTIAMRNTNDLEYYLYGCGGKWIIIDHFYLSQWYLVHLLNAGWNCTINIATLTDKYPDINRDLKMFGEYCFDEGKRFMPTETMQKIVEFYNTQKEYFTRFRLEEERNHVLFDIINSIKLEELNEDIQKACGVNNAEFSAVLSQNVENAIKGEWGYDSQLAIVNEDRGFSIFFEKTPEAINFEESTVEWVINSIFADIKKSIKKTVLYGCDTFEDRVQQILQKDIIYVSRQIKNTIPYFYVKDTQLSMDLQQLCDRCTEIKSNLLNMAMVARNGFRFNCSIEKVELRDLSEDELSRQAARYQRADGQFVYNGVFVPRERILEIIKCKFAVLLIVFKHQVQSSEETVFELKPFLSGPND